MSGGTNFGAILFNPTSMVHYRNIKLFDSQINGYKTRCVLNPRFPWFSRRDKADYETFYLKNDRLQRDVFDGVKAVVVFSAQARLAPCNLIQEAALRSIPVVAVEEVYQMMLEQGYVNEYFLPVDHLFVGSDYERQKFIDFGVPQDVAETTGCMFTYSYEVPDKGILKSRLGLRGDRRIATLSLAYQTPSGETMEVRRRLLELVSKSLPDTYELVVKPHPAEQDDDIAVFVRRFAPRAKTADKFTPIGDILGITDLLLNRGTSQVAIDALQRKIPVIAVPVGRKVFFQGLLDNLVAEDPDGLKKAIGLVEEKGFGLYGPVFEKYLNISSNDALKKVLCRIREIAEKNDIFQRGARLADIALFWAWMGYVPEAERALAKVKEISGVSGLPLDNIYRLVSYGAGKDDIMRLRSWAGHGYRQWLVQSLWIKSKYMTASKLSVEENEWFGDFPPRMNREYFIPTVAMLCWCYFRSGMRGEFESLLGRVSEEYGHLESIKSLKKTAVSKGSLAAKLEYCKSKFAVKMRIFLKNLAWERGG